MSNEFPLLLLFVFWDLGCIRVMSSKKKKKRFMPQCFRYSFVNSDYEFRTHSHHIPMYLYVYTVIMHVAGYDSVHLCLSYPSHQ